MMNRELFEESLIRPLQYWRQRSKSEVKGLLGKEVAQMVNYDQRNPHHCYDLFIHTLYTVQFIGDSAPIDLRVAAFFHDIGKPYVAQEKQERLVYYGHAEKSVEIARPLLGGLGYSISQVNRICFYIGRHDDFISWVLPTEQYDRNNPYMIEISADNLVSHIETVSMCYETLINIKEYELWFNLLILNRADASAQAEYVYKDGVIVDSREHKVKKIKYISTALKEVFSSKML